PSPAVLEKAARPFEAVALSTATGACTANAEPANSNPNGAYMIQPGSLYRDSISGQGQRRWYCFEVTEKAKITLYMSPEANAAIDNDLALYSLDASTGVLTVVAESQNPAGMYELLSYVAEPGYYFFCVAAFAGDTANEYSFLALLSGTWDEHEGDDSLLQAPVQPFNTPVSHTLDNSLDQDLSLMLVSEAGQYEIVLYGALDNVNYQLQILNQNMQVLTVLDPYTPCIASVDAGAYVLRLLSVDGNIDPTAVCKVLVVTMPDGVDISAEDIHKFDFTKDGSHFVESILAETNAFHKTAQADTNGASAQAAAYAYHLLANGALFDYQNIDFETTRLNTSTSSSKCSATTTSGTILIGAQLCTYTGSKEPRGMNLAHPLGLLLHRVIYSESHSRKSSNYSDVAGASNIVTGTDKYGKPIYTGYWGKVINMEDKDMVVIWDLDKMAAADFSPNWYHGFSIGTGYGNYGSPEAVFIEPAGAALT
ncbi:MAG: hypothetical protein K2L88_00180, partial [Clostridiales bacterium]|nr:hypothetical protein [Clostridiales bacterium]